MYALIIDGEQIGIEEETVMPLVARLVIYGHRDEFGEATIRLVVPGYAVACQHRVYGVRDLNGVMHCGEMSCSNYIRKHSAAYRTQ